MTKTSDHRSKHHSGNQSTLVEHVRTRAEQEQHHDERTHDDQVPLVQSDPRAWLHPSSAGAWG